MSARRQGGLVPEWFEVYPVEAELAKTESTLKTGKEDALFVDVAGGRGHDAGKFKAACPSLPGRCILQDLPGTLASVKKAEPPEGVELMEYDFFTPQPVKGKQCRFFLALSNLISSRCSILLLPQHRARLVR